RFRFVLANLQTSATDVEELLPALSNRSSFSLPDQLHLLETVGYHGTLHGYYYLFDVHGTATTALGSLSTESTITIKPTLQYTGKEEAVSFNWGHLITSKEMEKTGLAFKFNGKGQDENQLILPTQVIFSNFFFKTILIDTSNLKEKCWMRFYL